jgi:IS5 family transposase
MSRKVETQTTIADYLTVENPKAGFLDKVDKLIDWNPIEILLKKKYRRTKDATGKDAYPALMMFKAMLLQRWYNLSDPALEAALYDRLSFMRFCGLSLSSSKPDETTLCRFRNGLIRTKLDKKLLDKINYQFEKSGLLIRFGAIVDATVVASCRKPKKVIEVVPEDRKEDEKSLPRQAKVSFSADSDAAWLKKAGKFHYGYKCHAMVDAKEGFYLGGHATGANKSDIKELPKLLLENQLSPNAFVLGDKGYTSAENKKCLKEAGLLSGLMAKAYRNRPLTEEEKGNNRSISSIRYKVERAFGTWKKDLGFGRMRYLGVQKVEYELAMTGLAFNIKKAVNLSF